MAAPASDPQPLRWGDCSYLTLTGRGEVGVAFTTELDSSRWSCCDDPRKVPDFIGDRLSLGEERAQPIETPWSGGDHLWTRIADGWIDRPLGGRTRNTWIKLVAR